MSTTAADYTALVRVRPRWRRLLLLPSYYYRVRQLGLSRRAAAALAWNALWWTLPMPTPAEVRAGLLACEALLDAHGWTPGPINRPYDAPPTRFLCDRDIRTDRYRKPWWPSMASFVSRRRWHIVRITWPRDTDACWLVDEAGTLHLDGGYLTVDPPTAPRLRPYGNPME